MDLGDETGPGVHRLGNTQKVHGVLQEMKSSLWTADEEIKEHYKEPETTHQETNL